MRVTWWQSLSPGSCRHGLTGWGSLTCPTEEHCWICPAGYGHSCILWYLRTQKQASVSFNSAILCRLKSTLNVWLCNGKRCQIMEEMVAGTYLGLLCWMAPSLHLRRAYRRRGWSSSHDDGWNGGKSGFRNPVYPLYKRSKKRFFNDRLCVCCGMKKVCACPWKH